jgi:TonB family protein
MDEPMRLRPSPALVRALGRALARARASLVPRLLLLLGLAAGTAPPALAQSVGEIVGTVLDSAGAPILGADVIVEGTQLRALSDERGTFRITGVSAGAATVRARRLGFRPLTIDVQVAPAATATLAFRLSAVARPLPPVVVRSERLQYTGRLSGYYERLERRVGGYFITRQQIDRENPRMMSHLLQRVPGVSLVRGRAGITGIRMRGRNCRPLVWLDGNPMPSGEVDLDSFAPQSIQGIELYLGSSTPPPRYTWANTGSDCGTILLWSRGPDTDPPNSRSRASVELESLVASAAVFSADQVEERAVADPARPLAAVVPPSLHADGVSGLVVAEFVVDTLGRVEPTTIGIVSSTHPLFSDAVRQALPAAGFRAARRGGRAVRQLVHQPIEFDGEARRAKD